MSRRTLNCPVHDHLVPKKNTKSAVWEHFGLPADVNGHIINDQMPICKRCAAPVSAKGASTSNMYSHLKIYHPREHRELELRGMKRRAEPFQLADTASTSSASTSAIGGNHENYESTADSAEAEVKSSKKQKTMQDFQPLDHNSTKRCTTAVTKFLATTMQPYNLVDQQPFIDLVKTLNPRYVLPKRKYFSQTAVPKLFNETTEKLREKISQNNEQAISITTDCWTSIAGTPYLAITVHFITSEWVLSSACLSCTFFEVDHNADNICEVMTNVLSEWGINIKSIASCTTDNGSNVLKAAKDLKVPHVSCFGHNINIGVNHALELPQLKKAVARLKKLQNTLAHSWKMKRDLRTAQEVLNMEVVTLPSACPTRWWSTLKLCHRFLNNQLAICKLMLAYPTKKDLMLEGAEVTAIEDFVSATALLEDITKSLCGENYTSASGVLPLYRQIKKNLQPLEMDSVLLKKIKAEILAALEERYEREPLLSILRMCTLCDPRFRLYLFDRGDVAAIKQNVVKIMVEADESLESNSVSAVEAVAEATPKKLKGYEQFLEYEQEFSTDFDENTPEKKAERELDSYLAMPKLNFTHNPLDWWKSHAESFPVLKLLARKYLAIQATSVPSERVFSTGGNVITKHRTSLLPKNAEMQVFLAQNRELIC